MCISVCIFAKVHTWIFFSEHFNFFFPTVPKSLGAFLQPDLADGEDEAINEDIIVLQKKLQQVKFLNFFALRKH
jgi:hypothetical protein